MADEDIFRRWNHNLHYHRLILDALPEHVDSALDVGCGDGLLAGDLRGIASRVTALDVDQAVLNRARSADIDSGIDFVRPYRAATRRTYWEHSAPTVWPPPCGYSEMEALTGDVLPGARFRRHLFWRYSIVWRKAAS